MHHSTQCKRKYRSKCLGLFALIAGLTFGGISQTYAAEQLLQSIANHEAFETTEGNLIKLLKVRLGCRIEATFYGETGRNVESYVFNPQQLLYATRYEYHYSDGGLTNLSENHGKFATTLDAQTQLKVTDQDTLKDFKQLKILFPTQILKQCVA